MGRRKTTQEEAEKKILKKCLEKGYELREPFIYIGSHTTRIPLRCIKHNHKWNPFYHSFVDGDEECSICKKNRKHPRLSQEETTRNVLKKCLEKGYELVEPFIYIGSHTTRIPLRCLKDDHKWSPTYSDFIYGNYGCSECDKHRKRANEIASMVVIGDVTDRDIILIDDICDTGGTLAKAAGLLKEKGARSVRAFCTHPVLSGNAFENIENSALEELVVCDTIPVIRRIDKLKVVSVAELFAIAIRNAFENKSINSLFLRSKMLKKNKARVQ